MPSAPLDHPVSRYALGVLEGDIVAGDLVRLACERHVLDLETGADRGLWFDGEAATKVINFAKVIRHTTGDMAGKPLKLEPWQEFRHGSVFGWKKRDDAGQIVRRFNATYHQVAKKNGKTTDTAAPLLYTQTLDGEASPQAYCAATTRDQATILFRELQKMVRNSPILRKLIVPYAHTLQTPATDGFVKCLSRDGGSADGINPHFAARDEVHHWTDRDLAEIVRNSMVARSQPIDWAITTAGASRASICGELREYAEQVLRGQSEDDSFFAYVAEPPEDCDPEDPTAWAMANPNLGVSIKPENFRQLLREALAIQGKMPNFRRLHLNLWTEGEQTWIARDVWDGGLATAPFDPADLYGHKAYAAFDLSRTTDLSAIAVAIPVGDLIFLIVYSFIPEGPQGFIRRAQTENKDFVGWRDNGWLEVHRGGTIDEDAMIRRLKWIRETFDLQEVAFDRWGAKSIIRQLDDMRFPLVEHGQGFKDMSQPTKRFEACVLNNRFRHNGNPVLGWAVGNVLLDMDPAENVKPNKRKSKARIDPAVAAIMAVGRAEAREAKRKREIFVV